MTSLTRKSHHARAPMTKPNIPAWAYTTTCVSPSMPRSRDHCWNTSRLGVGKGNSGDLGRSWNTLRYTAPGMWALEGGNWKLNEIITWCHVIVRLSTSLAFWIHWSLIDSPDKGPVIGFRSDFSKCVNYICVLTKNCSVSGDRKSRELVLIPHTKTSNLVLLYDLRYLTGNISSVMTKHIVVGYTATPLCLSHYSNYLMLLIIIYSCYSVVLS